MVGFGKWKRLVKRLRDCVFFVVARSFCPKGFVFSFPPWFIRGGRGIIFFLSPPVQVKSKLQHNFFSCKKVRLWVFFSYLILKGTCIFVHKTNSKTWKSEICNILNTRCFFWDTFQKKRYAHTGYAVRFRKASVYKFFCRDIFFFCKNLVKNHENSAKIMKDE